MYKTILMTQDGTPTDQAIIQHVKELAKLAQSRVVWVKQKGATWWP